jgi:hypothetical protein
MSLLNGLFPIGTDSEGRTLPKCWLYSYEVGTNTPKDTYSDVGLTTPNANPLESDGSGWFANVYLGSGGYKLVLRDADDVVIKEQDNYYPAADGADIAVLEAEIAVVSQEVSQNSAVYTDSGAADAYVLTITGKPVAPTAYANGMVITFKPANANTGASVINVSGLGSRNLYNETGGALAASFLETSAYYSFIYESSNFRFLRKGGLVDEGYIATGAVTADKIGTNAVTTVKVLAKNITLAKIADGTAHELIAYDSSGVATTVTNCMRLLASGSLTAITNLDFVLSTLDTTQSTDNAYLIRLVNVQPSTDDMNLNLTISSDGGSTFLGGTDYRGAASGADDSGATVSVFTAGAAALVIAGSGTATESWSNAAGEVGTIEIKCFRMNTGTSTRPTFMSQQVYNTANGSIICRQEGGGLFTTAGTYDAIRLAWESGDWAAVGKYYIFAIPNTI